MVASLLAEEILYSMNGVGMSLKDVHKNDQHLNPVSVCLLIVLPLQMPTLQHQTAEAE